MSKSSSVVARRIVRLAALCLALVSCSIAKVANGPLIDTTGDSNFIVIARPNGVPNYWGFLTAENKSDKALELQSARFGSVGAGLDVVGFAVTAAGENKFFLETACGPFPPANFSTHPIEGYSVRPHEIIAVFAAVKATREGKLRVRDLILKYRAGTDPSRLEFRFRGTVDSKSSNEACRVDRVDARSSPTP